MLRSLDQAPLIFLDKSSRHQRLDIARYECIRQVHFENLLPSTKDALHQVMKHLRNKPAELDPGRLNPVSHLTHR